MYGCLIIRRRLHSSTELRHVAIGDINAIVVQQRDQCAAGFLLVHPALDGLLQIFLSEQVADAVQPTPGNIQCITGAAHLPLQLIGKARPAAPEPVPIGWYRPQHRVQGGNTRCILRWQADDAVFATLGTVAPDMNGRTFPFQRRWKRRLESERQVDADLEATLQVVQQQLAVAQDSNQRVSELAAALLTLIEELLTDADQP